MNIKKILVSIVQRLLKPSINNKQTQIIGSLNYKSHINIKLEKSHNELELEKLNKIYSIADKMLDPTQDIKNVILVINRNIKSKLTEDYSKLINSKTPPYLFNKLRESLEFYLRYPQEFIIKIEK